MTTIPRFKIVWAGTPNQTKGRSGHKPIAIVDHITAGNHPGCLNWMQNPKAQASAHYLVTRAGEIFQLVKDEDVAWHAGAVNRPSWPLYKGTNPNRYTIGIEHEGFDGSLTEVQYQATLCLHRQLVKKWNIPVDKDYIIGHYRIDSVNRPNCPGPKFPWDRLFKDLQGGGTVADKDTPAAKAIAKGIAAFLEVKSPGVGQRSTDETNVPIWAREAVMWGIANGLIDTQQGSSDWYRFMTVLHRYDDKLRG